MVRLRAHPPDRLRAAQTALTSLTGKAEQAPDIEGGRFVFDVERRQLRGEYMLAHVQEGRMIEQDVVIRSVGLQARGDIDGVADGRIVLHAPLGTQVAN